MAKYNYSILAGLFVCSLLTQAANAASVGSSYSPGQGLFTASAEFNKIFQHNLEAQDPENLNELKITNSDQTSAILNYGVYESDKTTVDIFGRVGLANLSTEGLLDIGDSYVRETTEYDLGPLIGFGAKGSYAMTYDTALSWNMQFNYWTSSLDTIKIQDQRPPIIQGAGKANVAEFQAAVLFNLIHTIESEQNIKVIPYAGPVFNWKNIRRGRVIYETPDFLVSNEHTGARGPVDYIGIVVGMDIFAYTEALRISIEGRFIAERAFTISANYTF